MRFADAVEQFRRAPDAVWDAQSLWPHNHHLIEDEQIEQAVLRGMGFQSITLEERQLDHVWPQPRLVDSVDRDICMPLLDVMVNGDLSPLDGPCCSRCDNADAARHAVAVWVHRPCIGCWSRPVARW